MNRDLIEAFLGKTVQVKIEGYTILGKLCSFIDSFTGHSCLMVLSSKNGLTFIKGNIESLGEIKND